MEIRRRGPTGAARAWRATGVVGAEGRGGGASARGRQRRSGSGGCGAVAASALVRGVQRE
ncbi:hypothetical protein E2562_039244 [Oryza meyeriana var. granulata]|uniref:Uncharacterized protein n=1 Tax=Oryza meyeriana var. granulata TaxID=110450 RepID=A0A6G1CY17_9ORYZ|nr:hypothetical protein E2562_039244 [Oryza meyeriana var. granulata]